MAGYDSREELISKKLAYLDFDALTDFTDVQLEEAEYEAGDILQIGEDGDVPEYRVIHTKRTAYDENNLPVAMYGFTAYWDRELQHEKLSNTARLPEDQPIRLIGRTLAARLVDILHAYQPGKYKARSEMTVSRMESDLKNKGMISDMIGLIELIVSESVVTDAEKAEADQTYKSTDIVKEG